MGETLDHTLVNPNYMCHHHIYVQDKPCVHKQMCTTYQKEDVSITLYMSGKRFGSEN